MTEKKIGVTLAVQPDTEEASVRVIEILARAAAGLALDGVFCELTIVPFEPAEEETSTPTD